MGTLHLVSASKRNQPRRTDEDRFVPLAEAVVITSRSRSSLIRDVAAKRFPAPVKLGPMGKWHWRLSIIRAWQELQERDVL